MSTSRPKEVFQEISPADFFYRNRDIAGFSNPSRAIYSAIRELTENSLDACEVHQIPPDIYVRLSVEGETPQLVSAPPEEGEEEEEAKPFPGVRTYTLRVADNGSGVPAEFIPSAFGQILYGSKYQMRQMRGTFGLGGKMAILYGQITTHRPAKITSSTGNDKIHVFEIMTDIQKNRPIILGSDKLENERGWHGTIVEFSIEGDYIRAMPKLLEYFKQTAMVTPYANVTFVDPDGRLYRFIRATTKMPQPPKEILPHPYGVDVETIRRIINVTDAEDMMDFLTTHFHRVGKSIAKRFLDATEIDPAENPTELKPQEIVSLVQAMKNFGGFLPPDASVLSPLGEDLLEAGIKKELNPEFIAVETRKPSAYSGFPFIVEAGIAYGGDVPRTGSILLFRFANRIPLLYDEASDVTYKVIHTTMNWNRYKVAQDTPLALVIHICSTKIPYKTVGKEFIADRPEVEKEILKAVREVSRKLASYLTRKESIERERKRIDVFSRYLPKIARFSTELAGRKKEPDINPLLRSLIRYAKETRKRPRLDEEEERDDNQ